MIPLRFVKVKNSTYIHKDDMAEYIREIAASEETDTRYRLDEAAEIISNFAVEKPLVEAAVTGSQIGW